MLNYVFKSLTLIVPAMRVIFIQRHAECGQILCHSRCQWLLALKKAAVPTFSLKRAFPVVDESKQQNQAITLYGITMNT